MVLIVGSVRFIISSGILFILSIRVNFPTSLRGLFSDTARPAFAPSIINTDGQDRQDYKEMMSDECGMMNEEKAFA